MSRFLKIEQIDCIVTVHCDIKTATLICSALYIINPDDSDETDWARSCAFMLSTQVKGIDDAD